MYWMSNLVKEIVSFEKDSQQDWVILVFISLFQAFYWFLQYFCDNFTSLLLMLLFLRGGINKFLQVFFLFYGFLCVGFSFYGFLCVGFSLVILLFFMFSAFLDNAKFGQAFNPSNLCVNLRSPITYVSKFHPDTGDKTEKELLKRPYIAEFQFS